MSRAAGASLPSETLSAILNCLFPGLEPHEYVYYSREVKGGLAAASLVCKHWMQAIRPILFRRLDLRRAEDVRFLKNIVYGSQFATSSLSGAIKLIQINQEATEAKPWLHHVHGLPTRLRDTTFVCTAMSSAQDPALMVVGWAPFKSIPRVTPSYIRLFTLTLRGLTLKSTTELARIVDSSPTLERCSCSEPSLIHRQLTIHAEFVDVLHRPSPPARYGSVKIRRFPSKQCWLLISSSLVVGWALTTVHGTQPFSVRWYSMNPTSRMWNSSVGTAVYFTWRESQTLPVPLCTILSKPSLRFADQMLSICASGGPAPWQGTGSPLAHIESITPVLSLKDVELADTILWDGLRAVADSPHMHRLCIKVGLNHPLSHEVSKRILCSVLRRTQLTWALESGKLQFGSSITSEDILSAEWLLPALHSKFSDINDAREEYLRNLVATRTSGASTVTDTGSEIVRSTADSTRHTAALEQAAEVPEADVQGSEEYEGGESDVDGEDPQAKT